MAPAERVRKLRMRYGSHDKLAIALGTSRQTVIRWEKGGGISEKFAVRLAELDGGEPDAFRPTRPIHQFREVRQEVEEVRDEVRALRRDFEEFLAALAEQGVRVSSESRAQNG